MVNNIPDVSLECPCFDVHHFVMYFRNELSKPERAEIRGHWKKCLPCYRVMKEVAEIMKGAQAPTRAEQLAFLRNLTSILWTIETSDLFASVDKMVSASRKGARHIVLVGHLRCGCGA